MSERSKSLVQQLAAPKVSLPEPYVINKDGTWMVPEGEDSKRVRVADGPVVITRLLHNVESGERLIELAWLEGSKVHRATARRDVVLAPGKLIELAAYGLPVTGPLSSKLVSYLSRFEAVNRSNIPTASVTRRMGWQERADVFLWGEQVISTDGSMEDLEIDASDEDAESLLRACERAGTLEGWRRAVAPIKDHPAPVVALLTSLASSSLKPLGREGFITDLAGPTSTGKTIAAKVAASAWGQPNPKRRDSIVRTWDSTRVGGERTAERRGSLPVVLDDTMLVRNPKEIEKLIYQQAAGRGRTRGRPDGLRDTPFRLSNMISTGEQPLSAYSEAGGARARVLSFQEPPFGRPSSKSKKFVKKLDLGACRNFGHAGPALVEYVAARREEWPAWRKACAEEDAARAGSRKGQGEVDRQADFFATLYVTADLARKAGVLPFDARPALDAAWDLVLNEAADMDKPRRAMLDVIDWLDRNDERLVSLLSPPEAPEGGARVKWSEANLSTPHGGWVGFDTDKFVGLYSKPLNEILEAHGYAAEAVRIAWRDREWIDSDTDRRTAVVTRLEGLEPRRLVRLRRRVLDELRER